MHLRRPHLLRVIPLVFLLCLSVRLAKADTNISISASNTVAEIMYSEWPRNMWRYILPEHIAPATEVATFAAQSVEYGGEFFKFSGFVEAPYTGMYQIVLRPGMDVIDMEATLVNASDDEWVPSTFAVLCLRNIGARDFIDMKKDRTFLHIDGEFVAIDKTTTNKDHCGHLLRSGDIEWASDDERRVYLDGSQTVDCSLIVRSSEDGERHVDIAWVDARSVSYNFEQPYNCIHSQPRFGGLRAGEGKTLRGRVYFFTGSRSELFEQFEKDFPGLGYGSPDDEPTLDQR
jgi:hypothetical protein